MDETHPVRKITSAATNKFIMKSVMIRFDISSRIITDNDTQFSSVAFIDYYEELDTIVYFASVAHPQSNGQVKQANDLVL